MSDHNKTKVADAIQIIERVYNASVYAWAYGGKRTQSKSRPTFIPRALLCYICVHDMGFGWSVSETARMASVDNKRIPKHGAVTGAVREIESILRADLSVEKWAILEVLRRFCEMRAQPLEHLLPPCKLDTYKFKQEAKSHNEPNRIQGVGLSRTAR